MLSYIKVNDIFDDLIDENKKLREYLKVLIEFKIIVDLYLKDVTIDSASVYSSKLKKLRKESEDVFAKNYKSIGHYNQMVIKTSEENIIKDEEVVNPQINTSQNSNKKLIEGIFEGEFNDLSEKESIVSKETIESDFEEDNQSLGETSTTDSSEDSDSSQDLDSFKCDANGCDFKSRSAIGLRNHKKLKHKSKTFLKNQNSTKKLITNPNESQETVRKKSFTLRKKTIKGNKTVMRCSFCRNGFKNISSLEEHEKTHKNDSFICDFVGCGKQYNRMTTLYRHKKSHLKPYSYHKKYKRVVSPQTNTSQKPTEKLIEDVFESDFNYSSEMKSIVSKETTEPEKSRIDENDLEEDNQSLEETSTTDSSEDSDSSEDFTPFKCDANGCEFKSRSTKGLESHKKLKHKSKSFLKNQNSTKKLITNSNESQKTVQKNSIPVRNFRKTAVRHKRGHSNVNKTIIRCSFCNNHFKCVSSLEEHEKTHKNDSFICDFEGCLQQYNRKSTLWRHRQRHLNLRYCCGHEGCHYRTGILREFRSHELTHKKFVHNKNEDNKCDVCHKTFANSGSLSTHIRKIHEPPEEELICGIDGCPKIFKNPFRLKVHQNRRHLGEKRFSCDFPNCDFKCVERHDLKTHEFSHTEIRPYDCTVEGCPKNFKTPRALKAHINLVHNSERNFKCEHEGCGKTFKCKFSLQKHETSYHSDIVYECDWPGCEYQTKWTESLYVHSRTVHSSELKFRCDWPQCEKGFKTKKYLKLHTRIHTNDRRYACHWPGCQSRFVMGGTLKKHLKSHKI